MSPAQIPAALTETKISPAPARGVSQEPTLIACGACMIAARIVIPFYHFEHRLPCLRLWQGHLILHVLPLEATKREQRMEKPAPPFSRNLYLLQLNHLIARRRFIGTVDQTHGLEIV